MRSAIGKVNLAIRSIMYPVWLFDKGEIGIRWGGGSGHGTMIPLQLMD